MTQLANFRPNKAGGPHYLIGVANEITPIKDVHNFGIAFFSPVLILITVWPFSQLVKESLLKDRYTVHGRERKQCFSRLQFIQYLGQ